MISGLLRKAHQVAGDPTLRHWLIKRAMGRTSGPGEFVPHKPEYLTNVAPLRGRNFSVPEGFTTASDRGPKDAIELPLAGSLTRIDICDAPAVFSRAFDDTETLLALHRFAWVPLMMPHLDAGWLNVLWKQWRSQFGMPSDGWPWHPYTAAERVINLIDYITRFGFLGDPEETTAVLARHGPAIAERLEYFGENYTSNHLSNNGRGLYRLGLFLDWDACTELGATILLREAERIFTPNGMLREGSSHYHMLLTRNYADAWLASHRHGRPEEPALRRIVSAAFHAGQLYRMPGRFPLIGDISPDCPPLFLSGLGDTTADPSGWLGMLDKDDCAALNELAGDGSAINANAFFSDGWLRYDAGPWSGLWHCAPEGWLTMPGHGHQDCGGFELHFGDEPVFIDLGRGRYGESGEAARYRSSVAHNTVRINGRDPYPPNRPYYDDEFRQAAGGQPPVLGTVEDGVQLTHHGFARLGTGSVTRRWQFADQGFHIDDEIAGVGSFCVQRRLHTDLPVEIRGNGAVIHGREVRYVVDFGSPISIEPMTCWDAYGNGRAATAMLCDIHADLPYRGRISVEVR